MTERSGNSPMAPSEDGEDLYFAPTRATPEVRGDWKNGQLRMAGESYPENPYEMFDAIISWVECFLSQAQRPLTLELQLNYLNTSSVRAMIEILDLLQDAHERGVAASVVWVYDSRNPRSAEMAEEFREDYSFEFLVKMAAA